MMATTVAGTSPRATATPASGADTVSLLRHRRCCRARLAAGDRPRSAYRPAVVAGTGAVAVANGASIPV